MRLSVPLAFLAIVATLLFVNLGWWVHYYEPSDEVLNVHAASVGDGSIPPQRPSKPSRPQAPPRSPPKRVVEARPVSQRSDKPKMASDEVKKAQEAARKVAASSHSGSENTPKGSDTLVWELHPGKSCQNYANDDATPRTLRESKAACSKNDACVAIECPAGRQDSCTLRAIANLVPYVHSDCFTIHDGSDPYASKDGKRRIALNSKYHALLKEYPFQRVWTNTGLTVNIMLVRSAPNNRQIQMIKELSDEILFLGISSFEDFPKPSVNPFSAKYPADKYVGLFPGFLHMLRPDDAAKTFPSHVKLLLMSQSDFSLPNHAYRDYSVPRTYDFTYSGSDQDVRNDCVGWSSFAKNWSFVKEALNVMCGEFKLKGVLVATIDKQNVKRCSIPKSCEGLITQTQYISQSEFHSYVEKSRFLFLPQIHDASPRVSTQALALDVPLLMNAYISGGWKYLNEKTGEFFHDFSDFRQQLAKIVKNADIENHYTPRKWVTEHYGNAKSCKRLFNFVKEEFPDWAEAILPKGTTCLYI